jgi:hypothetical protein
MRKLVLVLCIVALAQGLFALAAPVDLVLNTTILAESILTVNSGAVTKTVAPGQTYSIPYTYVGNELVKLKVTSAAGFYLKHTNWNATTNKFWVIPYYMTLDYGDGLQTLVDNGVAVSLVDTNGVYDLNTNFVVEVDDGGPNFPAGSYSDTLTFQIVAP